ncbi:Rhodanese-related sulfurtransferase [Daejeonella rubra]|uniref:Rhodanese-related sulfurtransferase n=1 Tax=Daejeonella rubra TaxID=990371 RepID=A0A1G9VZ96_9SPHI|nr:Rhodanese-related sulfurtransferase [Daejeonella rubra]
MTDISAAEFKVRNIEPLPFKIIDVREVLEYQTFNLGGDNIPLGKLLTEADDLEYEKDSEIIVICQRGLRSETARRTLVSHGFNNVRNLTGGILAIRRLDL